MATTIEQTIAPPTRSSSGFAIQLRIIGALVMRELHSRYGRENIGYLWLILEPMMLASMIGILHSRHATHYGSDVKPVPLALIGYCNFMIFRGAVNRAEGLFEHNAHLFYHRTVTPADILIARIVLEGAGSTLACFILMGLGYAFGLVTLPARPLYYLLGVFLMIWLTFAISAIVAGITHDNKSVGRLVHPVTYIMLPLSGAFLMAEYLPSAFRSVVMMIPMAHCFELMRYGWFRSASPDYIDPLYLGIWLLGGTMIGMLLLSTVRKRIELS